MEQDGAFITAPWGYVLPARHRRADSAHGAGHGVEAGCGTHGWRGGPGARTRAEGPPLGSRGGAGGQPINGPHKIWQMYFSHTSM